ncbi:MAG: hypothetical protein HUJ51_04810, partial [Eggerthellaceae bacterium]|nr:hypothetical protein [Eggerthellaceae bacterium]
DFNIFFSKKLNTHELITACNSMPFYNEKRLVELEDADRLLAKDAKEIINYIAEPNEFCVLAIYGKGLKKNSVLVKEVEKSFGPDALISCEGLSPWYLPGEIKEIGKKYGFNLVEADAKEILDRVGENTKHIDAIFQKFCLMFSAEELRRGVSLDRNFIVENIKMIEGSKPWYFTDAVSRKKLDLSLKAFNDFPKDSLSMLHVLLIERFKDLLCVKTCIEEGRQPEIKTELEKLNKQKIQLDKCVNQANSKNPKKFQPLAISNYQSWCTNFSKEELEDNILALIELDADFKSGKVDNYSEAFMIKFVNMCS